MPNKTSPLPATPPATDPRKTLEEHIRLLVHTLEKQNTFHRRFFLGVIHGLGTVIGATILAAVIIYLVASALHALGLDGILDALGISSFIEGKMQDMN